MPKVSSATFSIQGEKKTFAIYYHYKTKFYLSSDFPDYIRATVPGSVVAKPNLFETEYHLTEYYNELLEAYHKIIADTRKVIAYTISAPKCFQRLPEISKDMREMLGYAGDEKNTFGFTIHYTICFEKTGDGKKYFAANEDGTIGNPIHIPQHMAIVIDHTPQREEFLKNMEGRMQEMFLKIVAVMMDKNKFEAILDSGNLLIS